jgi:hypothetical protein
MGSFGQIPLNEIWAALEKCAPGHTKKGSDHYYCIKYGEQTYPSFPKGEHGKSNPLIEVGHIRKMARHLGILECVKEALGI